MQIKTDNDRIAVIPQLPSATLIINRPYEGFVQNLMTELCKDNFAQLLKQLYTQF